MRLTNTAEAAAYSGVVWQARSLNFQAYTNRAMIANQVAIAQVVSFASWMAYLETLTQNINYAVGWIPFVGAITGPLAGIVAEVAEVVREVGEVVVGVMDGVLEVIATTQQAVHFQAVAATPQIVEEVVERNDRNFKVTDLSQAFMVKNLADWQGFVEHYDSDDDKQRFADARPHLEHEPAAAPALSQAGAGQGGPDQAARADHLAGQGHGVAALLLDLHQARPYPHLPLGDAARLRRRLLRRRSGLRPALRQPQPLCRADGRQRHLRARRLFGRAAVL
jgi:hypothetical protein